MLSLLDDPEFDVGLQRSCAAASPAAALTVWAVHVVLHDGTQAHSVKHGGVAFDHILDAHERFGELAARIEVAPVPQRTQEAA